MPILAKNLKVIRKELGCTQFIMSEILKVGFRTFVRYEAGTRDVPVSVLVKIARLGNISLEQLLNSEIDKNDIAPLQKVNKSLSSIEVSVINFKEGSVIFNNPSRQEFITLDEDERKMLTLFRKMGSHLQKDCLTSLGQIADLGKSTSKLLDKAEKEHRIRKEKVEGIVKSSEISARQPKSQRESRYKEA
jgi:transcriptional regulator with XRE-family HTH domain